MFGKEYIAPSPPAKQLAVYKRFPGNKGEYIASSPPAKQFAVYKRFPENEGENFLL